MDLITEHYYTCRGRQRAVFLRPEADGVKFCMELVNGDDAGIEMSFDPVEAVRRGQGEWLPFEGGAGGAVYGATALRVNIRKVEGWVKFQVEQGERA